MELDEILDILVNQIHTVVLATNDIHNYPITSAIDIMFKENHKLYFLTARGKNLYDRLIQTQYISLTGIRGESTMGCQSISLSGKVKNIGQEKLDVIFEKNSYMNEIYPHIKARNVLQVFEIYEYQGEYFDLSQKPIYRQGFSFGKKIEDYEYRVGDGCIYCKACARVCPQKCIDISSKPVKIDSSHCLKCGKCAEICPRRTIQKVKTTYE